MMNKTAPAIYLAARYSRRPEVSGYGAALRALGYVVTSRWHDGESHQASEDDLLRTGGRGWNFASEDLADIDVAGLVVSFTEPPRELNRNRGGRHVEFGYALARRKELWLVGPRENVFHHIVAKRFETWPEVYADLEWMLMAGAWAGPGAGARLG